MVRLIKEQEAGVIGRREWWAVGDGCAIVAYGRQGCGISVQDKNCSDVTIDMATKLETAEGRKVALLPSIDTFLIECSPAEVEPLLAKIEMLLAK